MSSKNVNIITIHNEPNYGAILQGYALYHTIESLGYYPRMINLGLQFRKYPYNLIYRFLVFLRNRIKGYSHCYKIASNFCKKHEQNLIGNFFSIEQLKKHKWPSNDVYMVGSDQVWNPFITGNLLPAYTLSFLPDKCTKRFSYAASLGHIKNENELTQKLNIHNTLDKFTQITVREHFAVDFLAKNAITATEVIDPTLLIDSYDHLLPRKKYNLQQVLYLALGDNDSMDNFASGVASTYKLPLKKVYGYLQPSSKINKKFLPVEEWLYQIACSEVIVTDSFHAMVFSILFERNFYVYISDPVKIFRIENILNKLNLQHRIVNSLDAISVEECIDYSNVHQKLADYRESSLRILKGMLDQD